MDSNEETSDLLVNDVQYSGQGSHECSFIVTGHVRSCSYPKSPNMIMVKGI